jgi:arginyl-tRNA--protein-N-Asp/Glu arginylyltransferase
MFQSYHPVQLSSKMLDHLLANGWFRGGNIMYQSKMLCLEDAVYSVVNIRSNLKGYKFSKSLRKLMSKNKKRFSYSIQPLKITPEKDALYKQQSKKFKGFVHDNLENYLFEGMPYSNFTTYDLTVYDGDELVACSFFDLGDKSIASLLGAYNELYNKYSLGIFTMLLEIEFALKQGYQFYYPGYIFRNNDLFDYKLRVGQIEYFDWSGKWLKLEKIDRSKFPADQLNKAFEIIESQLEDAGIQTRRYLYPFFSLGYSQQFDLRFLHSIQFIQLNRMDLYGKMHILVYDFQEEYYSILEVRDQNELNLLSNSNFSKDIRDSEAYFQKLLSIEQIIFSSHDPAQVVAFLANSELIN